MIRPAILILIVLAISGCNYNPRPGGLKLMLQKQPSELPPRYYIPQLDPSTPSGIRQEDRGRRMVHDSAIGPVRAPGLAH
jgi:hypothetical protein